MLSIGVFCACQICFISWPGPLHLVITWSTAETWKESLTQVMLTIAKSCYVCTITWKTFHEGKLCFSITLLQISKIAIWKSHFILALGTMELFSFINWVDNTAYGLIMLIGHRRKFLKLIFRALALHQSEWHGKFQRGGVLDSHLLT